MTVNALKWWLLCRGEKAPAIWKVQYLFRYSDIAFKYVAYYYDQALSDLDVIMSCRVHELSKQGLK